MSKRKQEGYANVDLTGLPQNNKFKTKKCIDWANSINHFVSFSVGNFNDEVYIKQYIKAKDTKGGSALILIYKNIEYQVSVNGFRDGYLPFILFDNIHNKSNSINWLYTIGQHLQNNQMDILITDRKFENHKQYYKIKCLLCGFDSGFHYYTQIPKEEYWITSTGLKKLKQCPCCRKNTKIVQPGINDIPTTASWMIPYFSKGINEAKKYTKLSSMCPNLICPDCGRSLRKIKISNLNINKYNPCICANSISLPNKFLYFTLEQIKNELTKLEFEYSPIWIGRKRFDSFFILQGKKYIIEMDGGLGHGNWSIIEKGRDTIGLEKDKEKEMIASMHGIHVIRIPCLSSEFNYLQEQFINKCINILPLNRINWDLVKENCFKNIHKEICLYYESGNHDIRQISNIFHFCVSTIVRILKKGKEYGWCLSYLNKNDLLEMERKKVIELKKQNITMTPSEAAHYCSIGTTAILKVWKENGLYDRKDSERKRIEKIKNIRTAKAKGVNVFKDSILIGTYSSIQDLVKRSVNDFSEVFSDKAIYRVCNGERKQYKGYSFSYNVNE